MVNKYRTPQKSNHKLTLESVSTLRSVVMFLFFNWVLTSATKSSPFLIPDEVIACISNQYTKKVSFSQPCINIQHQATSQNPKIHLNNNNPQHSKAFKYNNHTHHPFPITTKQFPNRNEMKQD